MISITLTTYDLLFILATVAFSVWRLCMVAEDFARNASTIDLTFKRIPFPYTTPKRTRLNSPNAPTTASTDDPTTHSSSLNATYETNITPAIPGSFDAGVDALSHDHQLSSTSPQSILFKVIHATSDSTHSEPLRAGPTSEYTSPSSSADLRQRLDNDVSGVSRPIDRLAVHGGPSTSASPGPTLIDSPCPREMWFRLATDEGQAIDLTGELVDGDEEADQASIGEIPNEDPSSDANGFPVMIDSGERMSLRDTRPRLLASHGVQTVPLPPSPALPSTLILPLSLSSGPTPADNDDASSLPEGPLLSGSAGSAQNSLPFPGVEPLHIQATPKELQPPPIPPKNPRRRATALSRPPSGLPLTVSRKRRNTEPPATFGRPPLSDPRLLIIDKGKAREIPPQEDGHALVSKETALSANLQALVQAMDEVKSMTAKSSPSPECAPGVSQAVPQFEQLQFPVPLTHGTMYFEKNCSVHRIQGHEYRYKTMAWLANSQIPEPALVLDEHSLDATYAILDQQCQCDKNSAIVRIRAVEQERSAISVIMDRYDGTLQQLLESLQSIPPDRWGDLVLNCLTDIFSGVREMHSLKIFHGHISSTSILYRQRTNGAYAFYVGDVFDALYNPGADEEEQLMKNDFSALLDFIDEISLIFHPFGEDRVVSFVGLMRKTLESLINATSDDLSRLNYEQLSL